MSGGRVGRRYAQALFDIAISEGGGDSRLANESLDAWLADLGRIEAVFADPTIAELLENPAVPVSAKRQVVEQGLGTLPVTRRSFALLLLAKRRAANIGEIVAHFERMVNHFEGITQAEIVTAIELDEAETRKVTVQLETLTGNRIILVKRVDPAILGGVVARIGDHLIDGSVATRLAALREKLAQ